MVRWLLGLYIPILLLAWVLQPQTYAATITVNTTADELDTNTNCSLREAIQAANTNKRVGACAAGSSSGTDTITIPAGTYQLSRAGAGENANTTGDLDFTGNVRIVGGGPATIIDGYKLDRVFDIKQSASVVLQRLSVQNGRLSPSGNGGGIYNGGTLSLDAVTVQDSYAYGDGGGVYNAAGRSLTITNSTLRNNFAEINGGGLANYGTATLTSSSIVQQNQAAHSGGGIFNEGKLVVQDSTIGANKGSDGSGGGIAVGTNGTATVTNSTIRDNNAAWDNPANAGGVDSNGGPVQLFSSTVVQNVGGTGGITGNITITNTTVTDNIAKDEAGGPDCYGPITSNGGNTIGDMTNCTMKGKP
jgi:CSLREA domain-containing protein